MEHADQKNHLRLEDVRMVYGAKTVLEDIDLSVSDREFCTVVGPSGCGKSTLLRLILGQEFPTSGSITFMGEPLGFSDTRRGIVYQRYSLFPHLNVLQNVMLGKVLGLGFFRPRAKMKAFREEAMEFLARCGMEGHTEKYPHQLSGGMRQRVAIAQALIMRPGILLMDEPFGALDPGTRESMQMFILEIWEKSDMTVFFVTHDLEEAVFLGTRIVVLSQYYVDGRGEDFPRGARIVSDYRLSDTALPTSAKARADFGELIARIRQEGFSPEYRRHVTEFNLRHPDSFQTITEAERKKQ